MTTKVPINIAILDDYQLTSSKHFTPLQQSHPSINVTQYPHTTSPHTPTGLAKLSTQLQNAQIIITMRERTAFPAALLSQLPNLCLLLTTGNRNAAIDLAQCKKQGVTVAGTGRTGLEVQEGKYPRPDSTAQHIWALILGLARHVARDHQTVVNGGWQGATLATAISGRTIGLVGLGRLGTATGRIAKVAWGMRVLCWSANLTQEKANEQARSAGLDAGDFEFVDKETLFREADVVSLHVVLSERSGGTVSERELSWMKQSALLVNTSRGPLVDEKALLKACKEGKIRGAALDVFDEEPLSRESEWRSEKWGTEGRSDVLLSPHMGYGQEDLMEKWYAQMAENARRWIEGRDVEAKL